MRRQVLVFAAPFQVEVHDELLPEPTADQVVVATLASAISAGTELLLYRGLMPSSLPIDETIPSLPGMAAYPLRYGYAAVGRVITIGSAVAAHWHDQLVFSFQPHQSHFLARPADLIPVSGDPATLALLPHLETAVNLLLDGQPLLGEHVVVFGQGMIGLLVTSLLSRFPVGSLTTLDRLAERRSISLTRGAHSSLDPLLPSSTIDLMARFAETPAGGADLVFELSGAPAALDQAIDLTGYSGRLVIGSWYGRKPVALDLGGRFHRSKMSLIASQVSRIAPALSGRWTSARRLQTAATLLPGLDLAPLITHRLPLTRAAEAYALLDHQPATTLQVVFIYS